MQRTKLFFISLAVALSFTGWTQQLNNSPYTRYGLGEIAGTVTSPYFGMGGLSVPMSHSGYLNVSNPATYSSFRQYNPVFDVGVYGKFSELKTSTQSSSNNSSALRNFGLGLPVAKKMGVAFGIMPYSTSGYDITSKELINESDTMSYNYFGTGSLNRIFLGTGWDVINKGDTTKLSLGVNASYIFGTLNRERSVLFSDATYYNTRIYNRNTVSGVAFDAGTYFEQKINDNLSWQFGATYAFNSDLNARQDFYSYSFKYNFGIVESEKDTLEFYEDLEGTVTIPTAFSSGVSVTMKRLTLGAQYNMANWQNYSEVFGGEDVTAEEVKQSSSIILGTEIAPKVELGDKNKNLFQKSTYRLGLRYSQTSIEIENTQLTDYGMSFGMSLPLISSRSTSTLNLGVEAGQMGTTDNNLIQDNYVKFYFGVSLSPSNYDRWFRKRQYD